MGRDTPLHLDPETPSGIDEHPGAVAGSTRRGEEADLTYFAGLERKRRRSLRFIESWRMSAETGLEMSSGVLLWEKLSLEAGPDSLL